MAASLTFIPVPPPGHKFRDAHSRLFAGVRARIGPRSPKLGNLCGVCPEIHFADMPAHVAKKLDYLIAFHAFTTGRLPAPRGCVRV